MNPLLVNVTGKALEPLFKDLYESAKGAIQKKCKTWIADIRIEQLHKKIANVRNVKTIWQIDREVDLLEFYYPSSINLSVGKRMGSKPINSLDDFGSIKNIIIDGTVGQGKSIFLRYLCAVELQRGKAIPLFIEMRRIDVHEGKLNIKDDIFKALDVLGIPVDDDIFHHLANTGKLIIFFDAFDEVEENLRPQVLKQIENLCHKYENLRFVITSRPDSGIAHSACFRVFHLAPIRPPEIKNFILKLSGEDQIEFSERLLAAIYKSRTNIRRLLTTPLMITLLVITYKANQHLPQQLSEFYDGLFHTLLSRHDQSKLGYVRTRESKLSDLSIRQVFDALCFLIRKDQLPCVDEVELCKLVSKAMELTQIPCNAEHVVKDISKITCLLIRDGQKYYFIHKSISEYHAASFIKQSSKAEAFYAAAIKQWSPWAQELHFLNEIDFYRFNKHFLLIDIENRAKEGGFPGKDLKEALKATLVELSLKTRVDFHPDERGVYAGFWMSSWILAEHRHEMFDLILEAEELSAEHEIATVADLLVQTPKLKIQIESMAEKIATAIWDNYQKISQSLGKMENVEELFEQAGKVSRKSLVPSRVRLFR